MVREDDLPPISVAPVAMSRRVADSWSSRAFETCSLMMSGNRLDYVLKTKIAPDERARLLAEGRSLIGGG